METVRSHPLKVFRRHGGGDQRCHFRGILGRTDLAELSSHTAARRGSRIA